MLSGDRPGPTAERKGVDPLLLGCLQVCLCRNRLSNDLQRHRLLQLLRPRPLLQKSGVSERRFYYVINKLAQAAAPHCVQVYVE